jgi:hypothetical protein
MERWWYEEAEHEKARDRMERGRGSDENRSKRRERDLRRGELGGREDVPCPTTPKRFCMNHFVQLEGRLVAQEERGAQVSDALCGANHHHCEAQERPDRCKIPSCSLKDCRRRLCRSSHTNSQSLESPLTTYPLSAHMQNTVPECPRSVSTHSPLRISHTVCRHINETGQHASSPREKERKKTKHTLHGSIG